jgi:hypothetical protein
MNGPLKAADKSSVFCTLQTMSKIILKYLQDSTCLPSVARISGSSGRLLLKFQNTAQEFHTHALTYLQQKDKTGHFSNR